MKAYILHVVGTALIAGLVLFGLRAVPHLWQIGPLLSLQLHIGVAMVLAALLLVVLKRNTVTFGLLLGALCVTAQALYLEWSVLPAKPPTDVSQMQPFRVLHFNVEGDNLDNGSAIADYIAKSGADIAYIMEARPVGLHLDQLNALYPWRIGCGSYTPTCDLMVLSKYPLEQVYVGDLSDLRHHRFATAKINVHGTPVRLVAAHVSKQWFDDYHVEELDELDDIIPSYNGAVVLSGDFNASSLSADMQNLLHWTGMTTAGLEPATWPIKAGPLGVPIDHIYIRKPFVAKNLTRIPFSFGSNHYGLVADLLLPRP